MTKIVISYRRADSQAITGRIFDRLRHRFGKNSVFMDIDSIPVGVDFRAHVSEALHNADVMLVIVGRRWLNPQSNGRPTIHNASDWVRIELETGLRKAVRIVPVLVDGAAMPIAEELPVNLQQFAYHNALTIDAGRDFDSHMARLIRAIDQRNRWLMRGVAACFAVLLVGAGGIALWQIVPRPERSIREPAAAKGSLNPTPPVLRQPATTEIPRVQSTGTQAPIAPEPVLPVTTPVPVPAAPPSIAADAAPAAPSAGEPSRPPAPAKEVASLRPSAAVQPSAAPATRTVTAIEGEAFMLCGQPDFTVSMWQPRPNAPTEVSLRRQGMMMADGLSLQLARGKPRFITDNCEVTFVEIKSGFRPIAVLEEQRKQN